MNIVCLNSRARPDSCPSGLKASDEYGRFWTVPNQSQAVSPYQLVLGTIAEAAPIVVSSHAPNAMAFNVLMAALIEKAYG